MHVEQDAVEPQAVRIRQEVPLGGDDALCGHCGQCSRKEELRRGGEVRLPTGSDLASAGAEIQRQRLLGRACLEDDLRR
jgi:hypothetical protein